MTPPAVYRVLVRDLRMWDAGWGDVLDADERARAARYARVEDARRFVAARHLLRTTLGPDDAAGVDVRIDTYGRPYVPGVPAFSIAHSGDVVMLALAPAIGAAVGVDVERLDRGIDVAGLARHALAPGERAAVLGAAEPAHAFLSAWTRKEAVVKAAGRGLAIDPRQVVVPADGAALTAPAAVAGLCVATLAAPAGHVAALAWRA